MDWEAPVDAWYVWMAVAIVSFAIAGVALGVPSGPPPDANQAANTIDRVAGSNYQASGSYAHDAESVKIDAKTITLRNEHGTAHASIAFGEMIPANGVAGLENVTYGTPYTVEYRDGTLPPERVFLEAVDTAYTPNHESWTTSNGELIVRMVRIDAAVLEGGRTSSSIRTTEPGWLADRWNGLHYDSAQDEYYVLLVAA
ncbi:hypothetical protein OB919_06580 [Halobacteria archaeon AArc-curdl1]|uniref:Uncharacterized protein n=1 Tax=Natronosalvus hydrolyticus TaxID=2979988 RepID=A0AAP3E5Q5_9EURY|nr:hypothetical protein [Halobacteria archaeon AArc-curdl1]